VYRCFMPGCTKMHYVTHRSNWMEKWKCGPTCPAALFIETAPDPPKHEK
jgi:hypothetical protein